MMAKDFKGWFFFKEKWFYDICGFQDVLFKVSGAIIFHGFRIFGLKIDKIYGVKHVILENTYLLINFRWMKRYT